MQQEFEINDLKPGMYISGVIEQSGSVKIKTQGLVRTANAIAKLADKGVMRVTVDLDKSKLSEDITSEHPPVDEQKEQAPATQVNPVHFDKEISKASALYQEAKQLQVQAFDNMKAGKPIDTTAMKEVADGFIDSVFRNQDALACMTRMRIKDEYLMEHSINVAIIMSIFAKHLNLERSVIQDLATGALLHDLGKIGIPDTVLHKQGKLTSKEFNQIQQHVNLGFNVLTKSGDLSETSLEVVQDHHERLDGSGYPNGKKEEQLSIYARMIAIVDTYDAITADRCYQNARTPVSAFKILRSESGTSFDGELVSEFIKCMGIHPVGTLVKMKSNKLGIVVRSNPVNPIAPTVNIFYSVANKCYIESKTIDLSASNCIEEIDRSVRPEDFKLDMIKFFREILLN